MEYKEFKEIIDKLDSHIVWEKVMENVGYSMVTFYNYKNNIWKGSDELRQRIAGEAITQFNDLKSELDKVEI